MSASAPRLFWGLEGGGYARKAASTSSSSGSSSDAAAVVPHAKKLIDVSKGKLILAKSGTELLRSLGPTNPLNLIFIFGNARSGKSFLMNCLSGCPGLFQVLNSSAPCTKGVDVASTILPYKLFRAHADSLPVQIDDIELGGDEGVFGKAQTQHAPISPAHGPSPPQGQKAQAAAAAASKRKSVAAPPSEPQIGFVDVEGQGAEDNSYDTMLALPLLLTSRCVLFNHKGAPTVSDMLSKLGVLARAADYIDVGDAPEDCKSDEDPSKAIGSDDDAHAASKPHTFANLRTSDGHTKKFGSLHIIFRDFSFEGDSSTVHAQLLGLEATNAKLHAGAGGSKATKSLGGGGGMKSDRDREMEAQKAIQERNDIRNLLHANFTSIHVWLFKQPASADQLKAHKELPESLVDPDFIAEVHKLSVVLAAQLAVPSMFNGSVLSGPKIATLLSQITSSLNSNGAISVPSVFKAMEGETVGRVFAEVVAKFELKVERIRRTFPEPRVTLQAQLQMLCENMLEDFDAELEECILDEVKSAKRTELIALMTVARDSCLADNFAALLSHMRKIVSDATSATKLAFETWCAKVIPLDNAQTMELEFAQTKQRHVKGIHEALRMFPEIPTLAEFRYVLLESEEQLTEFFTFKLVSNDAAVKAHKITRLQEEAIAQQQLLVEQNRRLEEFLHAEKANTALMEAELARLRQDKEQAAVYAAEEKRRMDALALELERVRKEKKKKDCVIL